MILATKHFANILPVLPYKFRANKHFQDFANHKRVYLDSNTLDMILK